MLARCQGRHLEGLSFGKLKCLRHVKLAAIVSIVFVLIRRARSAPKLLARCQGRHLESLPFGKLICLRR
jgi:hypothetical protein